MNNNLLNVQDCWLTTDIVAKLKGVTERAVRLSIRKEKYIVKAYSARASLEIYNSMGKIAEVPAVAYLSRTYKEFPLGNIKAGDNAEYEITMSVNYAKLIVAGDILCTTNFWKKSCLDKRAHYTLYFFLLHNQQIF